jgi:hypothetical protein
LFFLSPVEILCCATAARLFLRSEGALAILTAFSKFAEAPPASVFKTFREFLQSGISQLCFQRYCHVLLRFEVADSRRKLMSNGHDVFVRRMTHPEARRRVKGHDNNYHPLVDRRTNGESFLSPVKSTRITRGCQERQRDCALAESAARS